jgi:PhnB protein
MPGVKPVPDWMHTVTPHLFCNGAARAIEFYKTAFATKEITRMKVRVGNEILCAMIMVERLL